MAIQVGLLTPSRTVITQSHTRCERGVSLSLLGAQNELMGFIDFAGEVLIVCQKLLEINSSVLIKEHTSNSWSKLFSESLLNNSVDVVSNKLRDLLTS